MAKTKLSIVRYLNAVPLAWSILEGPHSESFEPILSAPSECADQLKAGSVDIGLIPSIEYQRIPGCRIVSGPAVTSRHRVRSVLLISQTPLWRVKTVAIRELPDHTREELLLEADGTPSLPLYVLRPKRTDMKQFPIVLSKIRLILRLADAPA